MIDEESGRLIVYVSCCNCQKLENRSVLMLYSLDYELKIVI